MYSKSFKFEKSYPLTIIIIISIYLFKNVYFFTTIQKIHSVSRFALAVYGSTILEYESSITTRSGCCRPVGAGPSLSCVRNVRGIAIRRDLCLSTQASGIATGPVHGSFNSHQATVGERVDGPFVQA